MRAYTVILIVLVLAVGAESFPRIKNFGIDDSYKSGVAFQASLSKSISGSQTQHIIFDKVQLNIGNAYNVYHGNFIAPVDGLYLFSIYACSNGGHTIVLDLVKNGSTTGRLLAGDAHYSDCSSKTSILKLKRGDHIYVRMGTYGDLLYANPTYGEPQFTGVLLYRDDK